MWNDILANCDLLFILCTFIAHSINHGGISFNTWRFKRDVTPLQLYPHVYFSRISLKMMGNIKYYFEADLLLEHIVLNCTSKLIKIYLYYLIHCAPFNLPLSYSTGLTSLQVLSVFLQPHTKTFRCLPVSLSLWVSF